MHKDVIMIDWPVVCSMDNLHVNIISHKLLDVFLFSHPIQIWLYSEKSLNNKSTNQPSVVVVKSNEAIVMLLSHHLAMVPFLLVRSLYQLMFEGTKYCGSFEGLSLVCYSCYFLFFSCTLSHCQCIMTGAWLAL